MNRDSTNRDKVNDRKNKVLQEKLANPSLSQAQIAEKIGTSSSTVDRDLKDLKKKFDNGEIDKLPEVQMIADADFQIINMVQGEIIDRLLTQDKRESISARDLSSIAKDSYQRASFLRGDNSKEDGGEKALIELFALSHKKD